MNTSFNIQIKATLITDSKLRALHRKSTILVSLMCTFQSFNVCVYFGSKWYCTVFVLLFFFSKCLFQKYRNLQNSWHLLNSVCVPRAFLRTLHNSEEVLKLSADNEVNLN